MDEPTTPKAPQPRVLDPIVPGEARSVDTVLGDLQYACPEVAESMLSMLREATIDCLAQRPFSPRTERLIDAYNIVFGLDVTEWVTDIASDKAHEFVIDNSPAKPRN